MFHGRIERGRSCRGADLLRRWRYASSATQSAERAQQEIADDEDHDAANAEAAHHQRDEAPQRIAASTAEAKAAAPSIVLIIAALALVAEPHEASCSRANVRELVAVPTPPRPVATCN